MSREMRSSTTEDSIALRAFGIIRRRWVVATVTAATVLAAAVAFALYLPDLYRAHAIVLVERPLRRRRPAERWGTSSTTGSMSSSRRF